MTALAKTQLPGSLLANYGVNGFFDEMFGREGGVLPTTRNCRALSRDWPRRICRQAPRR